MKLIGMKPDTCFHPPVKPTPSIPRTISYKNDLAPL